MVRQPLTPSRILHQVSGCAVVPAGRNTQLVSDQAATPATETHKHWGYPAATMRPHIQPAAGTAAGCPVCAGGPGGGRRLSIGPVRTGRGTACVSAWALGILGSRPGRDELFRGHAGLLAERSGEGLGALDAAVFADLGRSSSRCSTKSCLACSMRCRRISSEGERCRCLRKDCSRVLRETPTCWASVGIWIGSRRWLRMYRRAVDEVLVGEGEEVGRGPGDYGAWRDQERPAGLRLAAHLRVEQPGRLVAYPVRVLVDRREDRQRHQLHELVPLAGEDGDLVGDAQVGGVAGLGRPAGLEPAPGEQPDGLGQCSEPGGQVFGEVDPGIGRRGAPLRVTKALHAALRARGRARRSVRPSAST